MTRTILPKQEIFKLTYKEIEEAIKVIRRDFEDELASSLNLRRASAPLFVDVSTGLNDTLSGRERSVSFDILEQKNVTVEIVHSLAKWKRYALGKYDFKMNEGIYTNMNAIRRDEETDNIHSLYVDQWDWEKIISKEDRTIDTLKDIVSKIYKCIKKVDDQVINELNHKESNLPDSIKFITTQEMENEYPELTPERREYEYAKKYGAIFIIGVGKKLESGIKHDDRAADYDDWDLNGDIILYYSVLDIALEISSMGIRVDEDSIKAQILEKNELEKLELPFQKSVMNKELPYTIGGGIGQSRLCMYVLNRVHIGEVQVSTWPKDTVEFCRKNGIFLL